MKNTKLIIQVFIGYSIFWIAFLTWLWHYVIVPCLAD